MQKEPILLNYAFHFLETGLFYQRDQWSLFKVTSTNWTDRCRHRRAGAATVQHLKG